MIFTAGGVIVFQYKQDYGDPTSFMLQICLDSEENMYITIYLGGCVLQLTKNGALIQVIPIEGKVVGKYILNARKKQFFKQMCLILSLF